MDVYVDKALKKTTLNTPDNGALTSLWAFVARYC